MNIRNYDARQLTDIFLVSAVAAVLIIRTMLHVTGYPQIGNGTFHIAHMLWGGLLMAGALMVTFLFLGPRVSKLAALSGGAGFGVFIDELGKFITRDHDYFYQPTIGLIYLLFAALYIISRLFSHKKMRPLEYQVNALRLSESALDGVLSEVELLRIRQLLAQAGHADATSRHIHQLVSQIARIEAVKQSRWKRYITLLEQKYHQAIKTKKTQRTLRAAGIGALIVLVIIQTFLTQYSDNMFDTAAEESVNPLLVGYFICTLLANICFIGGVIFAIKNRIRALHSFRIGLLINIFLTQFFLFAHAQFYALPFFMGNVLLLLSINFILMHENHVASIDAT